MKLALIGPARPFRGGISHYNMQLQESLEERHQVLLINFSRQYPEVLFPGTTQLEDPPGEVVGEALIDSLSPLSWRRAGKRLLEFSPTIAVFHWWHPFFGPAYRSLLRRLRQSPARPCRRIFLCHNVYPHESLAGRVGTWIEKAILRWVFSEVDGFLTHSREMVGQIRDLGCSAPVKQIYLPCFNRFGSVDRPSRAISEGPLHLLFFGNIRRYKGLEVLLQSLPLLPQDLDYQLRIAGEFYQNKKQLLEMASRLGVAHRIQWEDRYIPDQEVAEHFNWASVLISPYLAATQSGVIPVAYQFGVPVITTDVGGLSEVVRERKTGMLVPPGDASSLAHAIQEFSRLRGSIPWSRNVGALRSRLSWEQVEDAILSFSEIRSGESGTVGELERDVQTSQEANQEEPSRSK